MNDVHALSGAYAVDAVDDIERAHFEKHLAECPDCRAEVASLREAAALLSLAVPSEPTDALRDRVLSDITSVRPLPPLVEEAAHRGRSARRRFPALVAAAAAVLALGVGTVIVQPWADDSSQQNLSAASAVFGAPDSESFAELQLDGVSVTIAHSDSLDLAAIRTSGMPPPAPNKVYQLWLQKGATLVDAGLMDQGNGDYIIKGDTAGASQVLISEEVAGGVEQPAGSVVARIDLEQST